MNVRKGETIVHELLTRNVGEDKDWEHLGYYDTHDAAMARAFETVAGLSYNPYSREASSMTVHVSTCASYHNKATSIMVTAPVCREQVLDLDGRVIGSERVRRTSGLVWEYRIQHARIKVTPINTTGE